MELSSLVIVALFEAAHCPTDIISSLEQGYAVQGNVICPLCQTMAACHDLSRPGFDGWEYQITVVQILSRGKTTVDLPVYCRAYEIVKWELNKFMLCDMSAFEQEYSQVCL